MGKKRIYEAVKHMPAEELDKRIKKLEIRHLYRGMSVEGAADLVGVTKATGYKKAGTYPTHADANRNPTTVNHRCPE